MAAAYDDPKEGTVAHRINQLRRNSFSHGNFDNSITKNGLFSRFKDNYVPFRRNDDKKWLKTNKYQFFPTHKDINSTIAHRLSHTRLNDNFITDEEWLKEMNNRYPSDNYKYLQRHLTSPQSEYQLSPKRVHLENLNGVVVSRDRIRRSFSVNDLDKELEFKRQNDFIKTYNDSISRLPVETSRVIKPKIPWHSIEKCTYCGNNVFPTDQTRIGKSTWHKWCLKCDQCLLTLAKVKDVYVFKGIFYCINCYKDLIISLNHNYLSPYVHPTSVYYNQLKDRQFQISRLANEYDFWRENINSKIPFENNIYENQEVVLRHFYNIHDRPTAYRSRVMFDDSPSHMYENVESILRFRRHKKRHLKLKKGILKYGGWSFLKNFSRSGASLKRPIVDEIPYDDLPPQQPVDYETNPYRKIESLLRYKKPIEMNSRGSQISDYGKQYLREIDDGLLYYDASMPDEEIDNHVLVNMRARDQPLNNTHSSNDNDELGMENYKAVLNSARSSWLDKIGTPLRKPPLYQTSTFVDRDMRIPSYHEYRASHVIREEEIALRRLKNIKEEYYGRLGRYPRMDNIDGVNARYIRSGRYYENDLSPNNTEVTNLSSNGTISPEDEKNEIFSDQFLHVEKKKNSNRSDTNNYLIRQQILAHNNKTRRDQNTLNSLENNVFRSKRDYKDHKLAFLPNSPIEELDEVSDKISNNEFISSTSSSEVFYQSENASNFQPVKRFNNIIAEENANNEMSRNTLGYKRNDLRKLSDGKNPKEIIKQTNDNRKQNNGAGKISSKPNKIKVVKKVTAGSEPTPKIAGFVISKKNRFYNNNN